MKQAEKKRPPEERIAALMGKSAYVDLRDGVGGTNPLKLTDQDLAAAIGYVSHLRGRLAALVLETYYGSTLIHEQAIQRAWEDRERKPGDSREAIVLMRFGGMLAIHQLAGAKITTPMLAGYAFLIHSRRESLQDKMRAAYAWLDTERQAALVNLKCVLREPAELEPFRPQRKLKPRAVAVAS